MIDNAVWNLGGSSTYNDVTASMFYEKKRGTETYQNSRPTTWTGQIALMYPSDYGYATSGGSTGRDTCLSYSIHNWDSYSDCYYHNWLYDSSNWQWTLTPNSGFSSSVFIVLSYGNVRNFAASSTTSAVSPAVYLSSNVKIIGGNGSESSPFTLSL